MNVRRTLLLIGFLGSLASLPAPVEATDWAIGDVFAAVGGGVGGGLYKVYRNDGTFKETISDDLGGFTTGCAFSRGTSFLYTTNFSNTKVVKRSFGHPHDIVQTIDTGATSPGGASESIVFDAAGNFYVGHAGGNHLIHKYDASGALQTTFNATIDQMGTDWIDLAADQKTMFYTSEGRKIFRFDVSGTGTQLTAFVDLTASETPGTFFALRLLPPGDGSGGLLVADRVNIKRLNAAGTVVLTYDAAGEDGWFALALDPNGKSFWAGNPDTGNFYRFNISSGLVEVGPIATDVTFSIEAQTGLFGLCVAGEPTVAGDNDADDVINAADTCPNGYNPDQAACDTCRLDFGPLPSFCRVGSASENSPSPGTFAPGGPVVITATLTPTVDITVPRPDCFLTTFTFFDALGNPLHTQHRHRLAYGIFPGSPDIITIPKNTQFQVQCDVAELINLPTGTSPYVATFANNFQDSDIDPLTGVCTVSPCVNLSLVVVTSPLGTVTIDPALPPVTKVPVDIKPGGFPNSWNCGSTSAIPVAVLSTNTFDATKINVSTVRFGKIGTFGTGDVKTKGGNAMDVNGDGKLDMVFHFSFPLTGFKCSDIPSGQQSVTLQGLLTGQTTGGTSFAGSDSIRLVPGK